jgi:hypothetical protein
MIWNPRRFLGSRGRSCCRWAHFKASPGRQRKSAKTKGEIHSQKARAASDGRQFRFAGGDLRYLTTPRMTRLIEDWKLE